VTAAFASVGAVSKARPSGGETEVNTVAINSVAALTACVVATQGAMDRNAPIAHLGG